MADTHDACGGSGILDWEAWWRSARAVDELTALFAERDARRARAAVKHLRHSDHASSARAHRTALTAAGPVEVDTIGQRYDKRVRFAIKTANP